MNRIFVVGGGSSLNGFDFSKLSNEITIGVNYAYKFIPNMNYLAAIDYSFYELNKDELKRGNYKMCAIKGYFNKPIMMEMGVELYDGYPFKLWNSGLFGLWLAIRLGYKDIRLLGFDGRGGHFYDEENLDFSYLFGCYDKIRKDNSDLSIINYSIESTINSFLKKDLRFVFE